MQCQWTDATYVEANLRFEYSPCRGGARHVSARRMQQSIAYWGRHYGARNENPVLFVQEMPANGCMRGQTFRERLAMCAAKHLRI